MATVNTQVLAISGGVGGAKLSLGLAATLEPSQLHVLVNTGDDFEHLGLYISPDVDTLLYTLSGRNNQELGWGLAGETWSAMAALEELGGDTWFRLGDRDLATHLWRTQALAGGASLSEVTDQLAERLGVPCKVYPMTDDPVRTTVLSDEGELPFQHYFVRRQCEPKVSGFCFDGIDSASPNQAALELLAQPSLGAVIICPSNPFVSIDPVLSVPGMGQALAQSAAPVVAVSPIVAGLAIKGPAAKMMKELGMPVTALAVAEHYVEHYPGLVDVFVIDESDRALVPAIEQLGLAVAVTSTIMRTTQDKQRLAQFTLQLAGWEQD